MFLKGLIQLILNFTIDYVSKLLKEKVQNMSYNFWLYLE